MLKILADGEFHSGERLAEEFGLSRAAVWKHVRKLVRWGLSVESVSGRGYRLAAPLELLDADALRHALSADSRFALDCLDVFIEVDSTNALLLQHPPSSPDALRICIAEWQSQGRGRLERRWNSPLASGLCLSAAWTYAGSPGDLSALSLAAGVAVADAIAACCGVQPKLKWPNDLVFDGRKLGGILVESRFEAQGRCSVVVGVGINIALPVQLLEELSDWPGGAIDLRTAGALVSRQALAVAVAGALGVLLSQLQDTGPGAWLARWRELDLLNGRPVRVRSDAHSLEGIAAGIDDDGALLVSVAGDVRRILAGDASVRTP